MSADLLDSQTLPLPLNCAASESVDDSRFWLDVTTFSELAGIADRNARLALKRCHTGGTWHKTALRVRMVASAGGRSGQAYQVFAPSLPFDLAVAFKAKHPDLFKAPEVPKRREPVPVERLIWATDPRRHAAIEKAEFLAKLLTPAVAVPKYYKARPEIIRGIVASMPVTLPNGKTKTYDYKAIARLVAKFEQGGMNALIHAPRREKKPTRVVVSRHFDKTAPFNATDLEAIWTGLSQHIKNLFLSTHNTMPQIERLANVRLVELAKARGWADANLENCQVGIAQVRKFKALRAAAAKTLDAKKFADHIKPRVLRGRAGLAPMEIVMGDVHPVDILNTRDDGSDATARMVTWMDLATNRVFYNLFLFEKGRTITQAHIAESFVQMTRAWGLPSILYLDNGSEYIWKEMMDGFSRLSMLARGFKAYCMTSEEIERRIDQADNQDVCPVDELRAVVRATPHNPPGKAPIEGLFGVLERTVFCFISGWIGGDRMNKKTHKLGKKPRAFKGDYARFEGAVRTAIEYYHSRPQRDGASPNEKFARNVKAGWQAVDADYEVLLMALAERKLYKVENIGITIDDVVYWHDLMASPYVMGTQVIVYKAKWDTAQIILLPRDPATGKLADPVVAYRARIFGMVDKAGAVEAGRRVSLQNAGIRQMKAGSRPVDAVAEMAKYVALRPPAPAVPFGPKITLPEEYKGIREAFAQAGEPPKVEEVRLLEGQWIDRQTGEVRSMYEQTIEHEADPVATWEAEENERLIRQSREANALGDDEEEGLPGDRLTGQM